MKIQTILSVSTVGVKAGKAPPIVGVAWARLHSAEFVPCAAKFHLGSRRWTRVTARFPRLIAFVRELTIQIGQIDLVLVDVMNFKTKTMLGASIGSFLAGAARCQRLRYVKANKWLSGFVGPEARLIRDDDKLNVDIIEQVYLWYPHLCEIATAPPTARAVALLHYGYHRWGRE